MLEDFPFDECVTKAHAAFIEAVVRFFIDKEKHIDIKKIEMCGNLIIFWLRRHKNIHNGEIVSVPDDVTASEIVNKMSRKIGKIIKHYSLLNVNIKMEFSLRVHDIP